MRLLQAVPLSVRCAGIASPRTAANEIDGEVTLTFRITSASGEDETIIRLEGRLSAKRVEDLEKAVHVAGGTVLLDLSGLRSADAEGVLTLRSLAAKGAKLVGASPYIRQLLNEKSSRGKDDGQ
jgi:anti-anti-sigma regulatory factor